ncbi:MAG: DJ-1/PfpI family protein [Alphaproteobacteria bacterium]|nr:DJ-1/PfpI family protein [Rhodospirillaceae bacterium]MDG2482297.1 DJ-1/PfpI family protein [Alphaproteobacteria bacterium]MBT6206181.1 DJ-1/PfpI family protein [Rhodospirillaceae bacterium]MBT6511276.1 DJ-1/PfpI family protein [Rhodospirillaceae bacterium]MBT7615127.1 DJ-1/PfpI family protein [Rhodospirillaceae bacterium]
MARKTVAIYIFEGFEPLDAVGPFEAFISAETADGEAYFDVGMVGQTEAPVAGVGGLLVTSRWSFETMPKVDILLVPGGGGTRALVDQPVIVEWVKQKNNEVELMLSVCTGAQVLAAAGLLAGKKATTHWNTYDWLRRIEPTVEIQEGARWADNGRIVCSSGVSAGIDMALHIIERELGPGLAAHAARSMEYEYWPVTG